MATPLSNILSNASILAITQAVSASYGANIPENLYLSKGRSSAQFKTIPNVVVYCDSVRELIPQFPVGVCTVTCEVEQYAMDNDEMDTLINTAFGVFDDVKNNITPQGNGSLFILSAGDPKLSDLLETDAGTYVQQLKIEVVAEATP
jgi:hypothetical protein